MLDWNLGLMGTMVDYDCEENGVVIFKRLETRLIGQQKLYLSFWLYCLSWMPCLVFCTRLRDTYWPRPQVQSAVCLRSWVQLSVKTVTSAAQEIPMYTGRSGEIFISQIDFKDSKAYNFSNYCTLSVKQKHLMWKREKKNSSIQVLSSKYMSWAIWPKYLKKSPQ